MMFIEFVPLAVAASALPRRLSRDEAAAEQHRSESTL
jgi:hypothetical protein